MSTLDGLYQSAIDNIPVTNADIEQLFLSREEPLKSNEHRATTNAAIAPVITLNALQGAIGDWNTHFCQ
ncbi:uncharacterized protein N7498_006106 [Penicillium cinerascens]|uniref:Uncharacterized protein n=1 Tax=Penicillium cinerascens TaxID=70096 RepID=A0A9W9MHJ9_9EURO|nr:uncharacterized protein N7498_006106 [Penicillium cinerascens]KAJ5201443.1 hypothetical protein N7498_006106 [Penicillium cinerascens]